MLNTLLCWACFYSFLPKIRLEQIQVSKWFFMPGVSGAFAETSVDQLEVTVSDISCSSSVEVVVLSEEHRDFAITQLVFFSLWDSRWVFHTSERGQRCFSGNIGSVFCEHPCRAYSKPVLGSEGSVRAPCLSSHLRAAQHRKYHHTTGAWESLPGLHKSFVLEKGHFKNKSQIWSTWSCYELFWSPRWSSCIIWISNLCLAVWCFLCLPCVLVCHIKKYMTRCVLGCEFQVISGCDAAQGLWDIVRLYFFKSQKRSWTFPD